MLTKIKFTDTVIKALRFADDKKRPDLYQDTENKFLHLRVNTESKTFYFQRTLNNRKRVLTIDQFPATKTKGARDDAREKNAELVKGRDLQAERKDQRDEMTWGELFADFRVNRPRGAGKISKNYEQTWKAYFTPFANRKISEIEYDDVYKLVMDKRQTAPIAANRIQALGSSMSNYAKRVLRMKIENHYDFPLHSIKGRSRKTKRLQQTDMATFFLALNSVSDTMKDLFLTTLFSGRRIGECMKLRWVDLDLAGHKWILPAEIDGESNVKTGDDQYCMLPNQLVLRLASRQKASTSPWVFPGNSETGHVTSVNNSWKKIRAFGFQHLNAGDLRGSLGSFLTDESGNIVITSQQLGHSSIKTTTDKYVQIAEHVQREGMNLAEKAMLEAAGIEVEDPNE